MPVIFRTRLRSTFGCLRCKKSKKKCDEKQPKCSFCERWGFLCTRPTQDDKTIASDENSQRASVKANEQPSVETPTDVIGQRNPSPLSMAVSAFDPFHKLPIPDYLPSREITIALHKFFTIGMSNSLPFDVSKARERLARGWVHSMFADTAVCYSLVAYSIHLQSRNFGVPTLKITSLEYETRALAILQTRLHAPEPLSEETLFVAALHFTIFAFSVRTPQEIRKVWKGVGLMVGSHGGYHQLTKWMHRSTLAAIANCDVLASFLIAEQPLLNMTKPKKPKHIDDLYTDTWDYTSLIDNIGLPAANLLQDMRFVLFFRKPSQQTRPLSIDESEYLFRLLGFIDNRLGWLQAQYIGSGTLTEVVAIGLVVLKIEVISESSQHLYLVEAVLKRLQQALTFAHRGNSLAGLICLWACVVALVGSAPVLIRDVFDQLARTIMLEVYGSQCWVRHDLQELLTTIAWHDRLHKGLDKLLIDTTESQELVSPLQYGS